MNPPPAEARQEPTNAGSEGVGGNRGDPLADLQQLIGEVRALGQKILTDISQLVLAQWRLSAYVVTGSLAVWGIRFRLTLMIWGCVTVAWIFFNVAVWRIASDFSDYAACPPLAVVILNLACAGLLHRWRFNTELK